ncbi:hypothetical protein AC792_00425 [Arthrobacter sp. RIT-PI-e]|uniref:hypothetical protein n=1 Tax=Arthrobacter sp. RIT-PI-e TaxID=1681197 RepID=UPI000676A1F7|nr:hypothetical protein [Arthrobacter sp. RIT-PI-e]KNC20474.1 hypothetical protein AC792_00425 [Arthrobacter sp. RIT-PI-e]
MPEAVLECVEAGAGVEGDDGEGVPEAVRADPALDICLVCRAISGAERFAALPDFLLLVLAVDNGCPMR